MSTSYLNYLLVRLIDINRLLTTINGLRKLVEGSSSRNIRKLNSRLLAPLVP